MSKTKSFFLGFIIAGSASAIATLLTTPTSGKDLRDKIVDQGLEWKEMTDKLVQDGVRLKTQIAETSKEGISLINNLTDEMKKSVEEWKVAVEPHQENIHGYLEQIELSLKDLEEKVKTK